MKTPSLALAALALALTAGRAFGDASCVANLSQAGPNGSLCSGSSGPPPTTGAPTPSALSQANAINGALGSAAGSILGGFLVTTPSGGRYDPNQRAKISTGSVDETDLAAQQAHSGMGAAGDVLGGLGNTYADKLNYFRQRHAAEMAERQDDLDLLKGTSAEPWCAGHINIPFPDPPIQDPLNQWPNTVLRYDRQKKMWDQRCGGPTVDPNYQSFTSDLASLKPDAPAAPAPAPGVTNSAPQYAAAAPPPAAPAPAPADGATAPAPLTDETAAGPSNSAAAGSPAAPSAPAPASDSASSPSDNSNAAGNGAVNPGQSTNFFGIPTAKVTAADLADTNAPGLNSQTLQTAGGGAWSGIPQSKGMPNSPAPDVPRGWGTPEDVAALFARGRAPASPGAFDYLSRFAGILKDKAVEKDENEVKGETKKALVAEFGGLEGRILYNMSELPQYVIPQVVRAANGDMTPGQADWLTAGAVNVLYNIDSVPNEVMTKIAELGDAMKGIMAYGTDAAAQKTNDAVMDQVNYQTSNAASKAATFAHFGIVPTQAQNGSQTNMLATMKANAYQGLQAGKAAQAAVPTVTNGLFGSPVGAPGDSQ